MADNLEGRAEAVFEEIIGLPDREREAEVNRLCGDDAQLLRRVHELTASLRKAGNFLDDSTVVAPEDGPGPRPAGTAMKSVAVGTGAGNPVMIPLEEEPGAYIGPYKLLQRIGSGGFGTVYMADQTAPVKRRVALKVIKPGMDTREVIARFDAERQALAMMDHPNIARVFDAGATPAGRPYIVMELINGVPLSTYCDANHLTTRQRLELMIPVCRALHSAHQKGVIHRDLKPSNVLVTLIDGRPVPKVIDFGIAKATGTALTDRTLFTAFQQFVGTPAYMSPEQAVMSGMDIDTRADVYGLGVLLYELLTGTTPLDSAVIKAAAQGDVARMIRETEAPKPSSRIGTLGGKLSAVAGCRGTDGKKLGQLIRGELDWIVMKALEKDRARRYDTAAALADDLTRYLAGLPVSAGPPSGIYWLRTMGRRHRALIATVVAIAIVLLLAFTGTTIGLVRDARQRRTMQAALDASERDRAEAARQQSRAEAGERALESVLTFMTQDAFGQPMPDPAGTKPNSGLAQLLAGPASVAAGRRFSDQSLIEASVRQTLAEILLSMGRPDLAMPDVDRSLELRRGQHLAENDPAVVSSIGTRARVLVGLGDWTAAEPLAKFAWDNRARPQGRDEMRTLASGYNYATILEHLNRAAEAVPVLHEVTDGYRRLLGIADRRTLEAQCLYGQMLAATGRNEEAAPVLCEAWWESRRTIGYGRPLTMAALSGAADSLVALHRDEEAIRYCQWVAEWRSTSQGRKSQAAVKSLEAYASVLFRSRHYPEAKEQYKNLAGVLAETRSPSDPAVAAARARVEECSKNEADSKGTFVISFEQNYAAAMADADATGGPGHGYETLANDASVADACSAARKWEKAAALYDKVIEARHRQVPTDWSDLVVNLSQSAKSLEELSRGPEATERMKEALSISRDHFGPEDPETIFLAGRLAARMDAAGNPEDAAAIRAGYRLSATNGASSRPSE